MKDSKLQLRLDDGAPPVIYASGELDYENCDELGELIQKTVSRSGPTIAFALGELEFVDSSGLRILIGTAHKAKKAGGLFNITSFTPQLSHMLQVSGFTDLFEITAPPTICEVPATASAPPALSSIFVAPTELGSCHDVRTAVCDFAARLGFSQCELDDVNLAVGEAVSNAVRHGLEDCRAMRVQCLYENQRLVVTLEYPSARFDPESVPAPDLDSLPKGGMGIYFMKLVMDDVNYDFQDGHAVVRLEKRMEEERESRER